MDTKNIENYLNSFGQNVVDDSKRLLHSEKGSTALGKSIRFKVEKTATGVSGNKKKQSFKDYKGRRMSSPYSYTNKQPPANILSKWISKKGIKGRDKKTGRFISNMSLAFLIGKKIKIDGIKSLAFFQKPLGLWYDKLQHDFLKIFKQDIQSYLTTFTK